MINPNVKKTIEEIKKQLPEYHQETLNSFDWIGIAEEIGAKYRLSQIQIDAFVVEIALLVMQVTPPLLIKTNIMNHIGISEAVTHNALTDVNNRIITRLQTELTKVIGDAPDLMLAELTKKGVSADISSSVLSASDNTQEEQSYSGIKTIQSNSTKTASDPYREEID